MSSVISQRWPNGRPTTPRSRIELPWKPLRLNRPLPSWRPGIRFTRCWRPICNIKWRGLDGGAGRWRARDRPGSGPAPLPRPDRMSQPLPVAWPSPLLELPFRGLSLFISYHGSGWGARGEGGGLTGSRENSLRKWSLIYMGFLWRGRG